MEDNFGYEYMLDINKNTKAKGMLAVAQVIQNLCLIEPGTYPSDPELGIGIENEQFELCDDLYLIDLKNRIDEQITRYVPSEYYVTTKLDAKNISNNDSRKVLCLSVFIGTNSKEVKEYSVLFMRNEIGKLISRVAL